MKCWLLATLVVGLIVPGPATSAQDMVAKERGIVPMIVAKEAGIINIPSNHSVDETVDRLENILQSKEITLFALVDHSGEAAKVGMKMPPTKLLIFGNPKGGTPLMLAAPSIALDLPLKISGRRGRSGKGLALVQQPGVPRRAAWFTTEPAAQYRGHRDLGGKGWRVVRWLTRLLT